MRLRKIAFLFILMMVGEFATGQAKADSTCNCDKQIVSAYSLSYSLPTASKFQKNGVQGSVELFYFTPKGHFGVGYGFNLFTTQNFVRQKDEGVGLNALKLTYGKRLFKEFITNLSLLKISTISINSQDEIKKSGWGFELSTSYPLLVIKKKRILDLNITYQHLPFDEYNFSNFSIGIKHYGLMGK